MPHMGQAAIEIWQEPIRVQFFGGRRWNPDWLCSMSGHGPEMFQATAITHMASTTDGNQTTLIDYRALPKWPSWCWWVIKHTIAVHNFLRNLANRQTDRGENITSMAEVINRRDTSSSITTCIAEVGRLLAARFWLRAAIISTNFL